MLTKTGGPLPRYCADPETDYPGMMIDTLEKDRSLWSQRQEALLRARLKVVSEFLAQRNPAPGGMTP
jgi:hypothetical protein